MDLLALPLSFSFVGFRYAANYRVPRSFPRVPAFFFFPVRILSKNLCFYLPAHLFAPLPPPNSPYFSAPTFSLSFPFAPSVSCLHSSLLPQTLSALSHLLNDYGLVFATPFRLFRQVSRLGSFPLVLFFPLCFLVPAPPFPDHSVTRPQGALFSFASSPYEVKFAIFLGAFAAFWSPCHLPLEVPPFRPPPLAPPPMFLDIPACLWSEVRNFASWRTAPFFTSFPLYVRSLSVFLLFS